MDLDRLYEILRECTIQLRKGEVFEGSQNLVAQAEAMGRGEQTTPLTGGGVLTIDMNPPVSAARPDLKLIDCHFLKIGVDVKLAQARRDELTAILDQWPQPDRLAGGPSYIEVGGVIGDQGAAFQLFALGQALGLWKVITPGSLGLTGREADDAAGSGFVMISGYSNGGG